MADGDKPQRIDLNEGEGGPEPHSSLAAHARLLAEGGPRPAWEGAFGPTYASLRHQQEEAAKQAAERADRDRAASAPTLSAPPPPKASGPPDFEELAKRPDWLIPPRAGSGAPGEPTLSAGKTAAYDARYGHLFGKTDKQTSVAEEMASTGMGQAHVEGKRIREAEERDREAAEERRKDAAAAAEKREKEIDALPATAAFATPEKTYGEEVAAQSEEIKRREEEERQRKAAQDLDDARRESEREVAKEAEKLAEKLDKAAEAAEKLAEKAAARTWEAADRAGESRKEAGEPYDLSSPASRQRMAREGTEAGQKRMRDFAEAQAGNSPASREARAPFDQAAQLAGKAGAGGASQLAGKAGDLAGAMAGGEAAMAAGGPVGAALALADEVGKKVAGMFQTMGEQARLAGEGMAKLAQNDVLGAVSSAAEGAAKQLESIPIIGQVWAAEIRAATQAVNAFGQVVSAFVDRGKQLAAYSPALAQAGGRAELRSTLADIREAQDLGDRLAHLTDLQSELDVTVRELVTPIKVAILERIIPILQTMVDNARLAYGFGESMVAGFKGIQGFLFNLATGDLVAAVRSIRDSVGEVRDIARRSTERSSEPDYQAINNLIDEMAAGNFGGVEGAGGAGAGWGAGWREPEGIRQDFNPRGP